MIELISCDGCGVLLDGSKLPFPYDIEARDGSVDLEKAMWNGSNYVPFVLCPVCGAKVLKEGK
jgi:hypothetical protein